MLFCKYNNFSEIFLLLFNLKLPVNAIFYKLINKKERKISSVGKEAFDALIINRPLLEVLRGINERIITLWTLPWNEDNSIRIFRRKDEAEKENRGRKQRSGISLELYFFLPFFFYLGVGWWQWSEKGLDLIDSLSSQKWERSNLPWYHVTLLISCFADFRSFVPMLDCRFFMRNMKQHGGEYIN